jgi:DNA-binding Lrp family transcriptional regulator
MVDYGRSSRPTLRHLFEKKMKDLKTKQEKIGERLQRESLQDAENLAKYYSSWQLSAIHILTSIPEFQKVETISEKLNISTEQCASHLRELEKTGLVVNEKNLWKYSGKQMHVPENSYLVNLHHNNWRQQATLNSQLMSPESVHFTGVYSISNDDYETLKEITLKVIETMNKKATASGAEDLVVFCCDLFRPQK